MILSDNQIKDLKIVEPFVSSIIRERDGKVISYGLGSYGYDIRLSDKGLKTFASGIIDPKNFRKIPEDINIFHGNYYIIPALTYVLGTSVEKFNMPSNVTGVCYGKSTYARAGLITNVTPIEAGWRGHLTISLFNSSNSQMKVYANEGIAQVLFLRGEYCLTTYEDRKGKYQDQPNEVIMSKV